MGEESKSRRGNAGREFLIFVALLLPSTWFAWTYREMPHFGDIHDDGIYLSVAKAIASGDGYRTPDLPGSPWQTKYPPLYPLFLAAVWMISPVFPANLAVATMLSWITIILLLVLSREFFARVGFTDREVWCLTAALAINPYTLLFSVTLRPEPMFTCFLLGALLVSHRSALAGTLCGLSFLVRSAGLAALPGFALTYLLQRQTRKAIIYAACMLPAVLGWIYWSGSVRSGAADVATLYYLDYLGFQLLNVTWSNVLLYLWMNLDALISGIGGLLLTDAAKSPLVVSLTRLLAFAAVTGAIRLRQQPLVQAYAAFAVFYATMLVAWHYPPNARFVYPLFPLILAGFWMEVRRLLSVLRSSPHRWPAFAMMAAVASAATFVAYSQIRLAGKTLPETMAAHRTLGPEVRIAFQWLKANTPETAKIFCWKDPLVYLYSDRQSLGLVYPTAYAYESKHNRIVEEYRRTVDYARQYGLDYILVHEQWHAELSEAEHAIHLGRLRARPDLTLVYRSPNISIYHIRNGPPPRPQT